jgi:hypothetical protein
LRLGDLVEDAADPLGGAPHSSPAQLFQTACAAWS